MRMVRSAILNIFERFRSKLFGCERRKRVKNDFKIFELSYWKEEGVFIRGDVEGCG